jgi:hypothetical protein
MPTMDYMVGHAPAPASYAAPQVGASIGQALANLPQQYVEAAQRARALAMQNAFPGGLQYAGPLLRFLTPQSAPARAPGMRGAASSTSASVPGATGPANIDGWHRSDASGDQPSADVTSSRDAPVAGASAASAAPGQERVSDARPAQPPTTQDDLAVAQRRQLAAQHVRANAARRASLGDADGARRLAQIAAAHDARAREIYDRVGRQLRLAQTTPPDGFPYARQAANGHWYVPDERRPGRFKVLVA